ncbi:DUF1120 domain-containing protein [Pseudenterobacter timonensis]|uniref:hypothetical protein n=1 Tax=Pseudenterobacter timonensis TaxID=1755099 RepID=UPI00077B84A1|nr:hypothetical protein [Pseudenterobacter timonensis]
MKILSALSKMTASAALLLFCQAAVAADECQIISGTQQINHGRFIQEEMRAGKTNVQGVSYDWLATQTRTFDVTVLCDKPQKIRLYFDGPARKSTLFRFGQRGVLDLRVKNARIDDRTVQIATGSRGAVLTEGANTVAVRPGFGVAPYDGQEIAGRQFMVTVELTTYLSPKAFQTRDTAEIEETLTLSEEHTAP